MMEKIQQEPIISEEVKNATVEALSKGQLSYALDYFKSNGLDGELMKESEYFKNAAEQGLIHLYSNDYDPEEVDEFHKFFGFSDNLFDVPEGEDSINGQSDFEKKIIETVKDRLKDTKVETIHDVFKKVNVPVLASEYVIEEQNHAIVDLFDNTDPGILSHYFEINKKLPLNEFSEATKSEEVRAAAKRLIEKTVGNRYIEVGIGEFLN
jgi:hypothetical protein